MVVSYKNYKLSNLIAMSRKKYIRHLTFFFKSEGEDIKFILQNLITKRIFSKRIQTHDVFFTKRYLTYTTSTSSFSCIHFFFFNYWVYLCRPPSSLASSASHTHASFFTRFSFSSFSFSSPPLATIGVAYIGWSTALPPSWGGWQTASCKAVVFLFLFSFIIIFIYWCDNSIL